MPTAAPLPVLDRDSLVAAARALVAAYPSIEAVYLFGSRAQGTVRPGSDVDMAVFLGSMDEPEDRIEQEAAMSRSLEDRLDIPADVLVLHHNLQLPLLFEIFRVETILFARNPEHAHEVACRARAEFRDELPRIDRHWERVRLQIEERANAFDRA